MKHSDTITNLSVALAKAQAKMPVVLFDAQNPFLKNKYATLGAVISASKPILAEFGLAISQFPISQEGRVGVTSILTHESGEWLEETVALVPEGKGISINQAAGVTITYLRRYSWASILGMYADEDFDGENAATDEKVTAIMKGDQEIDIATGEVKVPEREWTDEQLDAILEHSAGIADTRQGAKAILDHSILPGNATVKAIESWFRHWLKTDGTDMQRAMAANTAYTNAKKKTGGK